jgi:hypothetical protein
MDTQGAAPKGLPAMHTLLNTTNIAGSHATPAPPPGSNPADAPTRRTVLVDGFSSVAGCRGSLSGCSSRGSSAAHHESGDPISPLRSYDAAAFARISQELLALPEVEHTLQGVVDLAVETIDGCDFAGITMRRGSRVDTPAATDPLVDQLDGWQYELHEGPCLDAVFVDDIYVIEDLNSEDRWPRWAPKAAGLGVQSALSVRLATSNDVVGALNLYSRELLAYDEDQILTASIYAAHAANAIAATGQIGGLNTALQTRHKIGMAQGLLMQRYHLSEDQAFRFLTRISQDANVKLHDVAAKVIAEATHDGQLN